MDNNDFSQKPTLRERFSGAVLSAKEAGFADKRALFCYALLTASVVIYILSRCIKPFAEFWTRYVSSAVRCVLGVVTSVFTFSIAECIVVCIPLLVVIILTAVAISGRYAKSAREAYKHIITLLCALCVLLSLFLGSFGPCYFRAPLEENLGIKKEKVSADELYQTAVLVSEKIKGEIENINFQFESASVIPYSYSVLVQKMNKAYDNYCDDVDYISTFYSYPKPIALSEPLTYTHISGMYSFFTGESNININYPDFIIPYTMAHEMAHQRGIAPEEEANFVAYLVCIQSDDAYIRYSAYANMYSYLRTALYSADKNLYQKLQSSNYPPQLSSEYSAYSAMFEKYSESTAAVVSQTVNNIYLNSQGQSGGTASYGFVVDLAVAYYKSETK